MTRILRERYADFGPTLAAERLAERHQIVLAKETVRRILVEAGLWIPRKLRAPKVQQPRARRPCVGELIQIDGCEHRWFEERAPLCTVLVYVDDVTSRLLRARCTSSTSMGSVPVVRTVGFVSRQDSANGPAATAARGAQWAHAASHGLLANTGEPPGGRPQPRARSSRAPRVAARDVRPVSARQRETHSGST